MAVFRAYDQVDMTLMGLGKSSIKNTGREEVTVQLPGFELRVFGNFSSFFVKPGEIDTISVDKAAYYKGGKLIAEVEARHVFEWDDDLLDTYINNNVAFVALGGVFLLEDDEVHGSDKGDTLAGFEGDDIVYGYGGDDRFVEIYGNDTLYGGDGDDVFTILGGDKTIYGGPGEDGVFLAGLPSNYAYSNSKLSTPSNVEYYFDSVEKINFGIYNDLGFIVSLEPSDLTDFDGNGSQATQQMDKLSDLYIAYFGRAPDVAGLLYWFNEIQKGQLTFDQTALSFSQQEEYKNSYPENNRNEDFIKIIYQNLFNREPEKTGLDYWKSELDAGMPKDSFILSVINGAYSASGGVDDRALLINKHDVSIYYAELSSFYYGEAYDSSINTLLSKVTADTATVGIAEEIIGRAFTDDALTLTGIANDQSLWDSYWG